MTEETMECEWCRAVIADDMESVVLTDDVLFVGTDDYPLEGFHVAADDGHHWCNVDHFAEWIGNHFIGRER